MLLQKQVMYSCFKDQKKKNQIHLEIIKRMCEGRTNCLMIAENVLFQSSLKCPKSGGQVWLSYSCGNNGIKESTPCQPLQNNVRKTSISFEERNVFQKNYLCNQMHVNFTLKIEHSNIIVVDGSSVDETIGGGIKECSKRCEKDSKRIYDGNLIQEIQQFGPSFEIEFKVLIRKFDGLVLNILDGSNKIVLSVTAEKTRLIVAFLEDSKIKHYNIENLRRNTWYHLTIAQKQSGENMYEVVKYHSF